MDAYTTKVAPIHGDLGTLSNRKLYYPCIRYSLGRPWNLSLPKSIWQAHMGQKNLWEIILCRQLPERVSWIPSLQYNFQ